MSPAPRKNGSSSNNPQAFWKTAHFKETTRSLVKKSAPFLLTALAGYVEHKWHEQEEEEQKQEDDKELEREKRKDREKEVERRASVESLRRQVDRLKRRIRRGDNGKGKGKQKARLSPESTESSGLLTRSNPDPDNEAEVEAEARAVEESTTKAKEIPRYHDRRTIPRERSQPREQYFQRPAYRESLPSERYFSETTRITIKDEDRRKPLWEQQREDYFNRKQTTTTTSSPRILPIPIIPPPRVPTPPISFPEPIPITLEKEKQKKKLERQSFDLHHRKSREWEFKEIIEQAPKRPIHRHHHRYSTGSKPTSAATTPGLSSEAMENAGRVAALAGFIEAVHIGDTDGDWIGEKGVRVATAAAGSAAVSYGRERIFGDGGGGGAKEGKGKVDGRGGGKGARDWKWRNGRWVDGGGGGVRRESCLEGEIRRGSEVLGDVGAGLLVSRLVLGSSHPVVEEVEEEDRRGRKRGRRWSYCY